MGYPRSLWRRRPRVVEILVVGLAAVVGGIGVTLGPKVLLIPLGLAAIVALRSPMGRLSWLAIGGLLVLQGSEGLSDPKIAYLVGLLVSSVYAAFGIRTRLLLCRVALLPALGAGVVTAVVMLESVVPLWSDRANIADVSRDGFTYLIIATGTIIGVDAGLRLDSRAMRPFAGAVGVVAAVSFGATWLGSRGGGVAGIGQFAFSSMALSAMGYAVALAGFGRRLRGSMVWLGVAGIILAAVLVTGTRTGLVLLVGLVACVGSSAKGLVPLRRIVGAGIGLGSVLVAFFVFAAPKLVLSGFLAQRLSALVAVASGGVAADQSGTVRERAYGYALEAWRASPVFGNGFGHLYPNPNAGVRPADYQLDTPVLILSKFGVVGGALMLAGLVAILAIGWKRQGRLLTVDQVATRVFATVALALLPFGTPMEDKGFGIALGFLVALSIASRAEEDSRL